jgi:phasin family protein
MTAARRCRQSWRALMSVKTKKAAPVAAKSYEEMTQAAQEQVEKNTALMFQGYGDFATLGKGHFEAVVKANTALAKGAEEISKELVGYARTSLEQAASATKALFGAKTLQDVIALNSDYAKTSINEFLANSAKLSDLTVKVANEAFEPINERVTVAIEKFGKPVAA